MCIASYNHWRKERAGAANRRRPLHPRALANKIAAARCPRLIPYGYRVGREVTSL
ncbi:hypothetical protein VEE13_25080 [Escherichia coli]|nr:hypothetical protein VEE13_25080 [Escherichia coli]